jgi:hypothetical protein
MGWGIFGKKRKAETAGQVQKEVHTQERLHTEKLGGPCRVVFSQQDLKNAYCGTSYYVEVTDKTSAEALKTMRQLLKEVEDQRGP